VHVFLKTNVEDTVSLIYDEALEILVYETLCVLEMIQETTRGRDQDVDAFSELVRLEFTVHASDDKPVSERVILAQITENAVNLESELTSRGDTDHTGTISSFEFDPREKFDRRDQKGQSFAGSGLGGAK